jgi:hypothetical protein
LSDTGLLALSMLGMCKAPRKLLNTKDSLAVLVKQQAAHGIFFAMFDNLNYNIMQTHLDYTLPVLQFETVEAHLRPVQGRVSPQNTVLSARFLTQPLLTKI